LRAQKNEFEQKRPLMFADKDLENAISAIDAEIAQAQIALTQLANERERWAIA
jgi:hypothetical protein